MERMRNMKNSQKVAASVALLAVAAALTSLGVYASFTSSATATQTVSSGTVVVELGAAGSADNRLTVGASNIAPGDTIQRAVKLSNTGTIDFSNVKLTTSVAPAASSVLDTDAANGLQMSIDKCSVAWTEAGPPYTYNCSGTTTSVLASSPVVGAGRTLNNLSSLTTGTSDFLRVTLTLPTTADNGFQNKSTTVDYSFDAMQRNGTSK